MIRQMHTITPIAAMLYGLSRLGNDTANVLADTVEAQMDETLTCDTCRHKWASEDGVGWCPKCDSDFGYSEKENWRREGACQLEQDAEERRNWTE